MFVLMNYLHSPEFFMVDKIIKMSRLARVNDSQISYLQFDIATH